MKFITPILLAFLLVLNACDNKPVKKDHNTAKEFVSANIMRYAKNLHIFDYGNVVKVEILNQEKGEVIFRTELVRDKKFGNHNSILIPMKKIAALSATQLGMITKLKGSRNLSATIEKKYIHDFYIHNLINHKKIAELGSASGFSSEEIIASKSQYVLYDDFGTGFPDEEKLKKLNIQCVPIADWQEAHPLGKAEWIILYGYLLGKEKEAISIFENLEKKYKSLKKIAAKQKNKPQVLSGNLIGDIWYAPAKNSYNAKLFADAGANYVYASETSAKPSIEKSMEAIVTENQSTEFWFNPGFSSKKSLENYSQKLKLLPVFSKGKIYCYSHNMNLFWERSASEPHKVLEDYIRILHPKALPKGELNFYKKVD